LSNGEDYVLGEPESFATLRSYFNDIRGVPLKGWWSFPSYKRLFAKLEAAFPETTRTATLAIKLLRPKHGDSVKKSGRFYCSTQNLKPLVDSFLQNETTMRQLSTARGAIHVLVIQPSYGLHATSEASLRSQTQEQYDFRRAVIAEVLKSDFCKQYCFDLSAVFDKFGGATHIDENVGTHYRPRIFINDVHTTDQGNEVIARELARLLAGLPIP
jgi:lysophospholipase L1-like esterase